MIPLLASLDAALNTAKTIAGIGGLIFVHELGHFLVGRACGVCAEAFSIGFGPVLAKWKPGETEYRISAVPLGGYVKFLGENPDERGEISPRSFHAATYPRKVAIMLAGVTMNVIAAFTLFVIAFSKGVELSAPVIGQISPASPASAAGLLEGDRVVRMQGHRILSFEDIQQETMFTDEVSIEVSRDGKLQPTMTIATALQESGFRGIGVGPSTLADTVDLLESSEAQRAGFLPGDRVISVNGTAVPTLHAALTLHESAFASGTAATGTAKWTVARAGNPVELSVPTTAWRIGVEADAVSILVVDGSVAARLGLKDGDQPVSVGAVPTPTCRTFLAAIKEAPVGTTLRVNRMLGSALAPASPIELTEELKANIARSVGLADDGPVVLSPPSDLASASAARDAGLVAGSTLVAVNGLPVKTFADLAPIVGAAGASGGSVKLSWREPGGQLKENVDVRPAAGPNASTLGLRERQMTEIVGSESVVGALALGVDRTYRWVTRIFSTLRSLVTGNVSAKHLQGPIAIARAGYSTAKTGVSTFFLFLGIISMNLAVLNVLPIPLLDGGQLALITIEKFRGKPLPERALEIVQWTGLILLLSFMVFVVTNDLRNF